MCVDGYSFLAAVKVNEALKVTAFISSRLMTYKLSVATPTDALYAQYRTAVRGALYCIQKIEK